MTETEELSVLVHSKRFWKGPIQIKMSRAAFEDPEGLGRTIAVPQIREKMELISVLRPTCEQLAADDTLEFKLESDVARESESTKPLPDSIPESKPVSNPSQQEIPYEAPESAYDTLWGTPPPGRPDPGHSPGTRGN